ncbi:MAG: DUF1573 domain-containing protein [Phycisphaerales bacterium]|nr:DUF1573 domain-containing protein [Phycisphaerales bacterium]
MNSSDSLRRRVIVPVRTASPQFRRRAFSLVAMGAMMIAPEFLSQARCQNLIAEPARLDLGAGHVSETLVGEIRLRNVSSERIRLYSVEPSCDSCTAVTFTNGWIEAGDATELQVSLRCSADEETTLLQSVTVNCSDRERPKFKVVLEGRFHPAIVVPTDRIDVGVVPADEIVCVDAPVYNWLPRSIEIVSIGRSGPVRDDSLTIPAHSGAGPGRAIIHVELEAQASPGPRSWELQWSTGLTAQPRVGIGISAYLSPKSPLRSTEWLPIPGGIVVPLRYDRIAGPSRSPAPLPAASDECDTPNQATHPAARSRDSDHVIPASDSSRGG